MVKYCFYYNCRNSRALIGQFLLSICGQTQEFEIHPTRQRARADNSTICYRKKQLIIRRMETRPYRIISTQWQGFRETVSFLSRDPWCFPRPSRGEHWGQGATIEKNWLAHKFAAVSRSMFWSWHLTRSPSIGKRIWVGRYNDGDCAFSIRQRESFKRSVYSTDQYHAQRGVGVSGKIWGGGGRCCLSYLRGRGRRA